jgi:hypothetical protein
MCQGQSRVSNDSRFKPSQKNTAFGILTLIFLRCPWASGANENQPLQFGNNNIPRTSLASKRIPDVHLPHAPVGHCFLTLANQRKRKNRIFAQATSQFSSMLLIVPNCSAVLCTTFFGLPPFHTSIVYWLSDFADRIKVHGLAECAINKCVV